ncbi:hypothetical protein NDI44_11690 [Trichocoleus sp. DQ-A3]|uniref:hypothetical protein n=2 Tax=Cyanophyceae TaxID=3028117 RepID=UPI001683C3C6|nr:hypothetical protein [Coleofasciculus sp. FACHB-125]MBD1902757.1 hypothetical protein [Coleofasciculus sp. FACHB-125]
MFNMSLGYAWEKFHLSVLILAGGQGSLHKRLYEAYTYQLGVLKVEQVPEELQEAFSLLKEELKTVKCPGKQVNIASVQRAIGTEKAKELAESIVEMYDDIAQRYGRTKQ